METNTAQRVRDCLASSGKTQAELAEELELTPSQLSKSLNGGRQFSMMDIARLVEIFDVSMHWLVTGQEDHRDFRLAARHHFNAEEGSYSAQGQESDRQLLEDVALLYRQAYS